MCDRVSRYATHLGVMGGSGGGSTTLLGIAVESQDYRGMIQGAIKEVDETAKIVDPRAFIGVYLMHQYCNIAYIVVVAFNACNTTKNTPCTDMYSY